MRSIQSFVGPTLIAYGDSSIFRVFLELPAVAPKRDPNQNAVKLPHIDKLCYFLIDVTRDDNEVRQTI